MDKIAAAALFLIIFNSPVFSSESDKSVISNADRLISNRQYQSAYELLNEKDPDNEKPAILTKKVDIALKYYLTSLMHEMFTFSNLAPDDDLGKLRLSKPSSTLYSLKAEELLTNLIRKYPLNAELYYSLGCYYYEVHSHYGDINH